MPMHLSKREVQVLDGMLRAKAEPKDALKKLQLARCKDRTKGPSKSAVYAFWSGKSYVRNKAERRGRKTKVPPGIVRIANAERLKLLKGAKNSYRVTWQDVFKATRKALKARGLLTRRHQMPSLDWLCRKLRRQGVRSRPGKRRISRKKEHEKRRHKQGMEWQEYPKKFWQDDVHAYLDTKAFVCPRNEAEHKLLRATKVTHHLRTPSEGAMPACVLPKRNRMLLGIPSIDVTAAVGQNSILMWHVSKKPWNGQKAADMYKELGAALRKHYGKKRSFRVVEDLDSRGFQSRKGIAAKTEERIDSWKLPPRSPGWMPLDFCLWDEIEARTLSKIDRSAEDAVSYAKRLGLTAKRLPRKLIRDCLGKVHSNIQATVAAKGGHTKLE